MEIPEILEAFKLYDEIYKREHVEEAVKIRDKIIPHLIAILERIVSDPTPYIENDTYFDHLYSVILLGYFGDPSSHEAIIDVFSLPGDIPNQIFGDIVTGELPAILFRTCGGSLDKIKSLALNKEAYTFCRGSALQAMVYAVIDGMIPREEVLNFFGSLFTGTEDKIDSAFWDLLAYYVCELYPEELMPVIRKAYKDKLIDPWSITPEDFEEALEHGKEYAFERIREDMKRRMPADVHDYMSWWACFKSDKEQSTIPFDQTKIAAPQDTLPIAPVNITTISKKDKKSDKQKRKKKMAEASRKKNRN